MTLPSAPPASMRPIALAAGGTGGHLFPAEALAHELLARGHQVVLVTDRRGGAFGDRLAAVAVHRVHAAGVLGKTTAERLKATLLLGIGVVQALWLLARLKPAVVVGFGGYPSVPTLLAAHRIRLPTVLHEQNAVLGRANRLLASRALKLAVAFADTKAVRDADRAKLVHTGNPVRAAVIALYGRAYPEPQPGGVLRLLITGGSQGARVFADVVPPAVASLPLDMRSRLEVDHQCRPEDIERTALSYSESGVRYEVAAFFSDMPARLARAHLAVCRAGASTIAELTVAGLPAILVPLPSAADDHQTANAKESEAAGAGWLIAQADFTSSALARRLFELLRSPDRLSAAARAAQAVAVPDAARRLADVVQLAGAAA
jgi:UDP-N-acetylglucosamine--N-acetylmuramyl-(pentapeptide) pyrophosphoryl-undecaprenol N-acetylglucosamine transferase